MFPKLQPRGITLAVGYPRDSGGGGEAGAAGRTRVALYAAARRACVPSERTCVLFSAREVLHARVMHYINRQSRRTVERPGLDVCIHGNVLGVSLVSSLARIYVG